MNESFLIIKDYYYSVSYFFYTCSESFVLRDFALFRVFFFFFFFWGGGGVFLVGVSGF